MDESRDMTFSELKEKDVVTVEGNNLGKPVDLVFSLQSQKVRGIVTKIILTIRDVTVNATNACFLIALRGGKTTMIRIID